MSVRNYFSLYQHKQVARGRYARGTCDICQVDETDTGLKVDENKSLHNSYRWPGTMELHLVFAFSPLTNGGVQLVLQHFRISLVC